MDIQKTGKFIAEQRHKHNMTQIVLAEQLGVSNKAVSKWENRRSLPDVSLFEPLCKTLEISVNELLAGEIIQEEDLRQKTDGILLEILMNKKRLFFFRLVANLLIVSGIVVFLFIPDVFKASLSQNIILRVMGVFIFSVGTYMDYKFGSINLPKK